MNNRFTLALALLTTSKNQKGFGIVMAFGIGLSMILAAIMIINHASDYRTKAFAGKVTFKAEAAAQSGTVRILNYLNEPQHRALISQNSDQWMSTVTAISTATSSTFTFEPNPDKSYPEKAQYCDDNNLPNQIQGSSGNRGVNVAFLNKLMSYDWISLDENGSKGAYRLRKYEVDQNSGITMIVEGKAVDNNSDTLEMNDSVRAIKIHRPYKTLTSAHLPGLWVNDISADSGGRPFNAKQKGEVPTPINATTWVECNHNENNNDYVQESKIDATEIVTALGTFTPTFNKVHKILQEGEESEQERMSSYLPEVPPLPSSDNVVNMGSKNWTNCVATLPRISSNRSTCNIKDEDGNLEFDTPIGDAYYYVFTGDNAERALTVNNAQVRIKPPDGKKVIIYADGRILVRGTGINHGERAFCETDTNPDTNDQVAIDSYIGNFEYPKYLEIYSTVDSTRRRKGIVLNDQNGIFGFIHGPETRLDMNNSTILGAAWVKRFDANNSGSSGCAYSIKQKDVGEISWIGRIPNNAAVPQLGSIHSWKTVEAE
ncbi:MAG: hypothetical protein AB4058_02545 [Microcystaceae cyanobacterium]